MIPTDVLILVGVIGYVALGVMSMVGFDRFADRDGPEFSIPGQYELVRFVVAVLWFLWPLFLWVSWRRRRALPSSKPERPPE